MTGPDVVFHAPQAEIFHRLMSGKSMVVSAPTSFGKSLVIDAVIATKKFNNIVKLMKPFRICEMASSLLY